MMSPTKEELKAQLMAEAEEAIDELVGQANEKEDITLSEIERLVRAAGQQVMTRLTSRLVEAKRGDKDRPICSGCGQVMRYKGHKERTVITETGEVHIQRAYYYCAGCRQGVFPPR
jgi:hypothetical protein